MTRILHRLLPEEPEVTGLLTLLLLTEARHEARVQEGKLIPSVSRTGPAGTRR